MTWEPTWRWLCDHGFKFWLTRRGCFVKLICKFDMIIVGKNSGAFQYNPLIFFSITSKGNIVNLPLVRNRWWSWGASALSGDERLSRWSKAGGHFGSRMVVVIKSLTNNYNCCHPNSTSNHHYCPNSTSSFSPQPPSLPPWQYSSIQLCHHFEQ